MRAEFFASCSDRTAPAWQRLACARAPTARCTRDHVACQNSSSIPFSRSDIRPSAVIRASVRLQERRRGPPFPCAATQAAADAASEQTIQALLSWLVANGVEGVGQDAKAALYVGEAGERGLVAVAPLKRGETVFKIPLKLAITDHPGDEESNALIYEGAAWSIRLAAKLLRMKSQGTACPWHPYLQALPTRVPSPLTSFSWEDIQAIAYDPLRRQLDHAGWLAASAAGVLTPDATGGADREQLEWALSVLHSRTFANGGRSGGPGGAGIVRMLCPLVDMLNHAGDVATAGPGSPDPGVVAADNVRWDVVGRVGGDFYMVVTTTQVVEEGQELLLSYGERSNDEFFLYYGFVPPRNPHDDVALFASIEDAIDWHLDRLPIGSLSPAQLQAAIIAAFKAAAALDTSSGVEASLEALDEAEADTLRGEMARMKLCSGGRLDGRLLAAFESLHGAARIAGGPVAANCQVHVREMVAARAAEIIAGIRSLHGVCLMEDLATLAAWEGEDSGHDFSQFLAHYTAALAAKSGSDVVKGLTAGASTPRAGAGARACSSSNPSSSGSSSSSDGALIDAGAASQDGSLLALLQSQAGGRALEEAGGDWAESGQAPSILPIVYRAYKLMILHDAALAAA